jgi:hypothetical protein
MNETATLPPPVNGSEPIPQPPPPATAEAAPAGVIRDSIRSTRFPEGRPWDATKYRANEDGTPVFDGVGRFIPIAGGRPRRDGTPAQPKGKTGPAAAAPDFSDVERIAREAVEKKGPVTIEQLETEENPTVETIIHAIQTALVFIGEDEGILDDLEKKMLRRPLLRVLQKYGVGPEALPPEWDLAFAIAAIVIKRLTKPKTATFFAKVKFGIQNWFARRKGTALARRMSEATETEQP